MHKIVVVNNSIGRFHWELPKDVSEILDQLSMPNSLEPAEREKSDAATRYAISRAERIVSQSLANVIAPLIAGREKIISPAEVVKIWEGIEKSNKRIFDRVCKKMTGTEPH